MNYLPEDIQMHNRFSNMKSITIFSLGTLLLGMSIYGIDTDVLLADLASPDYTLRNQARQDFKQAYSEASATLTNLEASVIEGLDRELPLTERLYLIRMLEWFGTSYSVDTLCALLDDANPEIQDSARRALVANPSGGAGDCLVDALNAAEPDKKAAFIDALVYRNDPGASVVIAGYLKGDDPELVGKAAQALGKLGNKDSIPALKAVMKKSSGTTRVIMELALLDIGASTSDLSSLARKGSSATVRSDAFAQLMAVDTKKAANVLKTALSGKPFPGRERIIHSAITDGPESLQLAVMGKLPKVSVEDQLVIVTAVGEANLTQFETQLLELLETAEGELYAALIAVLGKIGGDASYESLYEAFIESPKDRDIAYALGQLKAPTADASALDMAMNASSPESRIAAIKLLELRNTPEATDLLNAIIEEPGDQDVRVAAAKALETIGNVESVKSFIDLVIRNVEPVKQFQLSLKRLSLKFNDADYLWENAYHPALEAAPLNKARERVILILDGNAGELSLDYITGIVMDPGSELRPAAIQALARWPHCSAGDVWLGLIDSGISTEADSALAHKSILMLLSNSRTMGSESDKLELAVRAIEKAPSVEYKNAILDYYLRENLNYRYKRAIKRIFTPLLEDPDIADRVQQLIEAN